MRFGIPLKRITYTVFHSPKHKKISSFFPFDNFMAHAHQFGRPEVSFRYYLTFKTKPLAESFVKQHFELKIKEFSLKNEKFGR